MDSPFRLPALTNGFFCVATQNSTMYLPSQAAVQKALAMQEEAVENVLAVDAVDYVACAHAGVTRPFEQHGSYQTGLPWRSEDDPY